ncbi:hypothetical protein BST85_09450 [Aureitalea marina]|uniref:Uncharacterized protein n=1 Tax=Aureitalea marina TaxID=930804 RepID=A0A2S7KR40_9FLAO|nr:hypothetical protein BST85_09450 [Aureitalea marina]
MGHFYIWLDRSSPNDYYGVVTLEHQNRSEIAVKKSRIPVEILGNLGRFCEAKIPCGGRLFFCFVFFGRAKKMKRKKTRIEFSIRDISSK